MSAKHAFFVAVLTILHSMPLINSETATKEGILRQTFLGVVLSKTNFHHFFIVQRFHSSVIFGTIMSIIVKYI